MVSLHSLDPERLLSDVHAALRAWHRVGGTPGDLLESLLLVQEGRDSAKGAGSPAEMRLVTNKVLLKCLEQLETQDEAGAQVLRARFLDRHKIMHVASKLNVSDDTVNRMQHGAIHRLADILLSCEAEAREKYTHRIEAHLPPPSYACLFGLEQTRHRLTEQLFTQEIPWVVVVVGIGGIGKTALADAVTRQLIRRFHFEGFIWLRAASQSLSGAALSPSLTLESLVTSLSMRLWPQMPDGVSPAERIVQVRQALKARPHLVVIDNLETNEADTAYLLEQITDLAGPSKFLLTARTRPVSQAAAFILPLNELPLPDAAALLRQHAEATGVNDLASAGKADVGAIYRVVGGNPLALKLVVSLAIDQPLPQILADLARSSPGPIEDLYRHIYWKVWRSLSVEARALLQAMPVVAEPGAPAAQMRAISGLSEEQLSLAIRELSTRSLLEIRGDLRDKRYGIHRLTETFLRTEIIHWPEDAP